MKLTNAECLSLFSALGSLETEGALKLSPATRLALAKNLTLVSAANDTFRKVASQIATSFSDDGVAVAERNMQKFNDEMAVLLGLELDLPLAPVTAEDLNLEENSIPIGVLSGLLRLSE